LDEAIEEHTAKELACTFASLADGELAGWRPSIILSPTLVEDGVPIFISNGDVSWISGGRDFFGLFPEARDTFKVSTALRMNAAFPYVTPAISLPTTPPRRVVDAGYFDNYGVFLATEWIWNHRDWLRHYTSGIILVQIRAYPRDTPTANAAPIQVVHTGFQWLTSPVEAYANAKKQAMIAHNDMKLQDLEDWFNVEAAFGFLSSPVLEAIDGTPLSWTIGSEDRQRLLEALNSVANITAFESIAQKIESSC
jgi:hypothetical protein